MHLPWLLIITLISSQDCVFCELFTATDELMILSQSHEGFIEAVLKLIVSLEGTTDYLKR